MILSFTFYVHVPLFARWSSTSLRYYEWCIITLVMIYISMGPDDLTPIKNKHII